MNKILYFLSRWPVIIFSFIAMNLIGYSFLAVQQAIGGDLLDFMWSGQSAAIRLAELSEVQKAVHLKATIFQDSLYPIAYGSFFVGLITRLSATGKQWLLIAPLSLVIFDFIENLIQIRALQGNEALLQFKDFVTPLKFGCFYLTLLIVLFLVLQSLYRKYNSRNKT